MESFSVQAFFSGFFNIVLDSAFLWLPVIFGYALVKFWIYYARLYFVSNIEWVLLDIKLPKEVTKSPRAMEMVLNSLYQMRDGNRWDKYWQGLVRAWYSLEIVSLEGKIHFYIYVQKGLRGLVEEQIYAQYPEVEIMEAEDYTRNISAYNEEGLKFYSTEFALKKDDAYPIRTYIDYELHKLENEEEQKTDPMSALLEFMGSLKGGEQLWFQVLIRATTNTEWKNAGAKIIDKLLKRDKEKETDFGSMTLSPGERMIVEAIERNVAKLGYDVCIRAAYLAKEDKYRGTIRGILGGVMEQYGSNNLNAFKLVNKTGYLDHFYQFPKTREGWKKERMFDAYVRRSAFYSPHKRKLYILNTEELATIYHFPGAVITTPTLARIEAKKGEPPAALPV
ncbi:hypothetical protein C4572_04400 [Candidatus Parcubacteria bacterium]|nr:MAG: hypothetical protein C4572_04400 [Candidatus Parcubacteria bacterium]